MDVGAHAPQRRSRNVRSAAVESRAAAKIGNNARSATDSVNTSGVLNTGRRRAVAALKSM